MLHNHNKIFFWILMIAQIIVFGVLAFFIINAQIIPTKYLMFGAVAIVFVFGIEIVLSIASKWTNILAIILAFSMIGASLFGIMILNKAETTIEEISSDKEYYDEIVILVKVDSEMNELKQLNNKSLGVQTMFQPELMHAAQCILQERYNLTYTTVKYNTVIEQILALINGDVDFVIYNKSHEDLLIEQMPEFTSQTRSIKILNVTESDVQKYQETELNNEPPLSTQPTQPTETTPPTEPEITEPTQPSHDSNTFAVYISGIDAEGRINVNGRSDVNMLAIVNPDTKKIMLINTPRDYFVKIPGISGDKKDKLTHAGIYGVQASINTLSALYDVPIEYYVRVNFTSFEDIVDALGGIEVYSAYSFESRGATFKKGMNQLNGEEALKFCRERYSFKDGDNQRGRNQQEVIKAIIKKACSPKILTSAMSILDSVRKNIDMNVSDDFIRQMIKDQLESGTDWEIITMAATGTDGSEEPFSMPGYKAYVMIPNEESVETIKAAIKEMYK